MDILGIPVTIVSGFLGSGKTTLINQVLAASNVPKEEIIIIENEFGETGIDHELLLHTKEQVLQLNNGCMCCSLRGDLINTLESIEDVTREWRITVSQIIIETTGIADPQPIIQTLLTAPTLHNRYYIDSILTVVDTHHIMDYLKEPLIMKQIAIADRMFLSVKEEADKERLPEIGRLLYSINPLADQLEFYKDQAVMATEFFNLNKFQAPVLIEEEHTEHAEEHHHDDHGHEHHEHEHHHDHDDTHGFQSLLLETDKVLNKALLVRWLDWLVFSNQERLYRFKGMVTLKDQELAMALQGVNQQINFQLTTLPAGMTKIVLIGKELNVGKIERTFERLCTASNQ